MEEGSDSGEQCRIRLMLPTCDSADTVGVCYQFMQYVQCDAWEQMFVDLVKRIDRARALLQAEEALPAHMHSLENKCFHDLCKRIQEDIPRLPQEAVTPWGFDTDRIA